MPCRIGARIVAAGSVHGNLDADLAAAITLDPDLATYRRMPVRVELRGERTRGATLCDLRPELPSHEPNPTPPVTVATTVRSEVFLLRFVETLLSF